MTDLNKKRTAAPDIDVDINPFADERTALIDRLDAQNPEFKHSFQRLGVDQGELDYKHQEVVMKGDKPLRLGGDIVVKTPIEYYKRMRATLQERSRRQVLRLVSNPDDVMQVAKPVVPQIKES